MKILFLTHYFPPEVNAPATRTYEHCARWVKEGHEVTVLTCEPNCPTGRLFPGFTNRFWPKREVVDGVNVVRVWTFLAANSGKNRRCLNFLTYFVMAFLVGLFQKRPNVIIATSPQFFCGLAGVFLGRIRRIKTVLEVRDIWPASIQAVGAIKSNSLLWLLVWLERLMYSWSDHIVTVGSGYKKHILERTGNESQISIISNGVDLKKLQPLPVDDHFKKQFGLGDSFVCSYVGTLGMAHGLEVVLDAAKQLKKKGRTDIKFCLVGDGANRIPLEQSASQQGVGDLIRFTGLKTKSEIPQLLAGSDALLVHLEGTDLFSTVIPSKIFEAMAMERPIIMGVRGPALEMVLEANAGISMEPGNASDLVRAVELLCDDHALRARLCETSRKFVAAHFDRDELAFEYLTLLHRVAGIEMLDRQEQILDATVEFESNSVTDESIGSKENLVNVMPDRPHGIASDTGSVEPV